MKAIVCTQYGGPEVLQLKDVKKPSPRPDEILIKMHATSVTASDAIVRGFKLPIWHPIGLMMGIVLGFRRPRQSVLGMIVSGEVVEKGEKVRRFAVGDRVFGWTIRSATNIRFGTYAQYVSLSESCIIMQKPSELSYEEAAAVPYGGLMALAYLRKGHFETAKQVLIYGASGAIGTAAVQLAKACGAEVTAVCSAPNHDWVARLGAKRMIDYKDPKSLEILGRYDLVLDAVGKAKRSELKTRCRKALAKNGRYISVDSGSPKIGLAELEYLRKQVGSGKFKAVIDRKYTLGEMAEAHRYVDGGHKKGNVIITIT